MKSLIDRCTYAFIGFLFGAVLGAVLWLLYDRGWSAQRFAPHIELGLGAWIRYTGGVFAALGFVLKAGAGDVAGSAVGGVARYESHAGPGIPRWVLVIFVLGCIGIWYLHDRHGLF